MSDWRCMCNQWNFRVIHFVMSSELVSEETFSKMFKWKEMLWLLTSNNENLLVEVLENILSGDFAKSIDVFNEFYACWWFGVW